MTILLLLQALSFGPIVDSLATAQQFSGVVLIARDGKAITEKAYGMADREARKANNIETAFNLGSINKFFTQIAIRQLKVDLDSTLGHYWPDYPNEAIQRVTIRQLLEHRSGIGGNIFAAPTGGKRSDIRKLSDYLPLFVNEPPQFEPGAQQQYSNAGYIVLGLLVERLSGENYYSYVQKHIYSPAQMTRTAHWAVDSLPANTAIGYTTRGEDGTTSGEARRNSDLLPGRGSSAGGGYSTAHDLLRFINALRDSKIPGGQGLGFGIAGGAPGLNAIVDTALPGGYDVIVLANLDPPAAERMGKALRDRIRSTP
jgi:CubicO group peptidase (beta-lactamase class C family)